MRVVYPSPEQNDKLAILIANRLEANDFQPCQCLAMMDGDKLAGVVVYFCYRHPSIEIAIFSDDPRWVTNRDMVGEILAYPFVQLGCKRVTAMVDRHNKRSRKMVKGLGFDRISTSPTSISRKTICLGGYVVEGSPEALLTESLRSRILDGRITSNALLKEIADTRIFRVL